MDQKLFDTQGHFLLKEFATRILNDVDEIKKHYESVNIKVDTSFKDVNECTTGIKQRLSSVETSIKYLKERSGDNSSNTKLIVIAIITLLGNVAITIVTNMLLN